VVLVIVVAVTAVVTVRVGITAMQEADISENENVLNSFSAAPAQVQKEWPDVVPGGKVEWRLVRDGIVHKVYEVTVYNPLPISKPVKVRHSFTDTSFDAAQVKNARLSRLAVGKGDGRWVRADFGEIAIEPGVNVFRFEFDAPLVLTKEGWGSRGKWGLTNIVDPWWDGNWTKRKEITLGSHPDNFQIFMEVQYDADMKSDFSDLRFLEDEASGELDYWIENKVDGSWARLWVRRVNNSDSSIWMYYGNASASPVSNENDTFIFADTFDGDSLDLSKWDVAAGSVEVVNGYVDLSQGDRIASDSLVSTTGTAMRVVSRMGTSGAVDEVGAWDEGNGQNIVSADANDTNYRFVSRLNGSYTTQSTGVAVDNAWRVWDIERWDNSATVKWTLDNGVATTTSSTNIPTIDLNAFARAESVRTQVDYIFIRKLGDGNLPDVQFGAEESYSEPHGEVVIENIAVDNCLLDRDVDVAGSGTVTGAMISVDVEYTKLVVRDNVRFLIYDGSGSLVDNATAQDNAQTSDNSNRFTLIFTSDNWGFADGQLGGFDVTVTVGDNEGYDNDATATDLFHVSDVTSSQNVENLAGHRIRTYGTVSAYGGAALNLSEVRMFDNAMGEVEVSLDGNSWENIRSPPSAGKFYLTLDAENLDGVTDNFSYEFPNFAPSVVSVEADTGLIDRDMDYTGSGADTDVVITARVHDDDNDFPAWLQLTIRDSVDAVVENLDVLAEASYVADNEWEVVITYDAEDNDLSDSQLGAWDVLATVKDNWAAAAENWTVGLFTVDDRYSSINFDPEFPYLGWELTVSGTHSRYVGSSNVSGAWLVDNVHGQQSLGASDSYSVTYAISDASLGENVGVTVRSFDGTLDGVSTSSYLVNENVMFEVWVRYEENYELVPWVPDENRPLELEFQWEGGTHTHTLDNNPENVVVPSEGIDTSIVKLTDNDAYWRYVIPEYSGGQLTFVIVEDVSELDQFRFFLQDYTGMYSPPNGQLLVKLWVGENLAEINSDYWGADWRNTAWLRTGIQYQMWVRGENAPLRLVGPIDAVAASEEKTIIVSAITTELEPIFDHVYWSAWRESDNVIRVEYRDNLDNTIEAHVGIYSENGDLLQEYQVDNEWFVVTYASANGEKSYTAVLTVTHGYYGDFALSLPVASLTAGPPGVPEGAPVPLNLPSGLTLGALGSIILVFVVGLSFDAIRVQLGVLAMAFTTLFCWWMGFLPLPGPHNGAYTATLILVMAVLFALTWRRNR